MNHQKGGYQTLYFWSNIVTPHWIGTLRHIGDFLGVSIVIYGDDFAQPASRREFGWSEDTNQIRDVDHRLKPKFTAENITAWQNGYHLICNPFNNGYHRKLIRLFNRHGIRYGFQQSPPGLESNSLGRLARWIAYRSVFNRSMLKAQYILCHGSKCRRQFIEYGIPENKLFASGYFVDFDAATGGIGKPLPPGKPMNAVYLGQFVERKQVVPFARALAPLIDRSFLRMDFIGSGVLGSELANVWRDQPGQVLDPIAHKDVIRRLNAYDVLVLPSRADEWAVVVNEAIHAGCAIIVTDKCGSSDMVAESGCGVVVKDAVECAGELARLSRDPDRCYNMKQASSRLSPAISSVRGARYIGEIILNGAGIAPEDHLPPWAARPPEPGAAKAASNY